MLCKSLGSDAGAQTQNTVKATQFTLEALGSVLLVRSHDRHDDAGCRNPPPWGEALASNLWTSHSTGSRT